MTTALLTILALSVLAAVTYFLYYRRKHERRDVEKEDKLTMDKLLEQVKREFVENLSEDAFAGRDDQEYEAGINRQERLSKAFEECVYGKLRDKMLVKKAMAFMLSKMLPDMKKVCSVMDYNGRFLDPGVKFEILMYFLKKKHGKDSMSYIIHKYRLDKVYYDIEKGETPRYRITIDDLNFVYNSELGVDFKMEYREMLDITATLLYQPWKGFGSIDTLREMNIDGINGGVSGSILYESMDAREGIPKAPRSIWIYFEGKRIFLEFLTFGSENELRRVIQLMIRHKKPGQLTSKRGFIVTPMEDRARLLAIRPEMSDYWGFVIRKFNLKNIDLDSLYNKKDEFGNPLIDNVMVAFLLLEFIIAAKFTPIVTGRQGSGKTTAMIALVYYISGLLSICSLELLAELYLREYYPNRRIMSISDTPYVKLSTGQDAARKGDNDILIVGEIAEDKLALNYIQAKQTYMQTMATYHGVTASATVSSLADSAMRASGSNDRDSMERLVAESIDFDIHFDYDDVTGFRYIDRVTEILPIDNVFEYTPIDPKNLALSVATNNREYYIRSTDRRNFVCHDILVFDKEKMHYNVPNKLSDTRISNTMKRLPLEKREKFSRFIKEQWGVTSIG